MYISMTSVLLLFDSSKNQYVYKNFIKNSKREIPQKLIQWQSSYLELNICGSVHHAFVVKIIPTYNSTQPTQIGLLYYEQIC